MALNGSPGIQRHSSQWPGIKLFQTCNGKWCSVVPCHHSTLNHSKICMLSSTNLALSDLELKILSYLHKELMLNASLLPFNVILESNIFNFMILGKQDQIDIPYLVLGSKIVFNVKMHTDFVKWSNLKFLNSALIQTKKTKHKHGNTFRFQQIKHQISNWTNSHQPDMQFTKFITFITLK